MRRNQKGFTLVELIIVIAIMAILAGIAVPTYVSYIKEAHKGVDEQLISDVAYSLRLAAYADPGFLGEDAYVVGLRYNEEPVLKAVGADEGNASGETKLARALEMTFGDGCTQDGSLQLTYDGWNLGAVSGLLSYGSSGYAGNEESLLRDIQTFTNSLCDFLGQGSHLDMVLNSPNSPYADYLKSMGAETSQEVANATTLYLAQYAADKSDPEEYANWWTTGLYGYTGGKEQVPDVFDKVYDNSANIPSEILAAANRLNNGGIEGNYDATGDIMYFYGVQVAAAEAAYQYMVKQGAANPDDPNDELTKALTDLQNVTGLSDLMGATSNFNSKLKTEPYKSHYQSWCTDQAADDARAYINCLKAINESADAFSGNLSNSTGNLYTDGKALSLMTSYISTVEAIEAAGLSAESQAVAVTICRDSNGNVMVTIYKNGEALSDTGSAVEEITGTVIPADEDLNGEDWMFDMGSKEYQLSVGSTRVIKLSYSVEQYSNEYGDTCTAQELAAALSECPFASSDESVAICSTKWRASGDQVVATLTVKAVGEGTAVVSNVLCRGGYTFTVTGN